MFLVLKNYQDKIVLSDTVYIDEKYFKVSRKNIIFKNGKQLRGLSRNQICVSCGTDNKNTILIVNKCSKLDDKNALKSYGPHIKARSKLIHDEEPSHNILVEKLKLKSEAYNSKDLLHLEDKENPLFPINKLHDFLNKFMLIHSGFNREELQDWMNLFAFICNTKGNKYDKALAFINLAISTKINIKYRDIFA